MDKLRQFAITLLNDEEGVSYPAWVLLRPMLKAEGHTDVIQAIEIKKGRVVLSDESAANL